MKFGKIQKFSVALKIWLKNESFDHSKPAKDEIWQNPEKILICVENLAQKWDFWPLLICEGWNFAKSRNFDSCRKFSSNWHFWPLGTYERWNLATSRNFERPWKFGSKLRVLTTLDLRRIKFGEIKKFKAVSKIWLKKGDFWQGSKAWPANDEIWQNPQILSRVGNPQILSRVENFAQNWDFWLLRTCEGYEIWQNPEILKKSCCKFGSKWDFWPLRTCKEWIGQNQEILSRVENLAINGHFWLLGTWKGGNLVKFRNFQSQLKFWSKLRVSTTQNLQRMNLTNPEI